MGTSNDVLALTCSGTGAMEASVTNFFSPGDRVIVCSAGKFGERWVELAKAYGLAATVLEAPYGDTVASRAPAPSSLRRHPRRIRAGFRDLHRRRTRRPRHG